MPKKLKSSKRTQIFAVLLITFVFQIQCAQAFDRMFVFGDSLSDVGNLASVTTGQFPYPYSNGRVRNGPVAVEVLAQLLNVVITPSFHLPGSGIESTFGTNFAVAGANANNKDLYDLKFQVDAFITDYENKNLDDALVVVMIGGNDIREARDTNTPARANEIVLSAATAIQNATQRLITTGVKNILLVNVPDISRIPETIIKSNQVSNSDQYIQNAKLYTNQLNQLISQQAAALRINSMANVFEANLFGVVNNILDNPSNFGFSNVTDGCFDTSPIRFHPDCQFGLRFDDFAFFDNIHPTTKLHEFIGSAMFDTLTIEEVEESRFVLSPVLLLLLQ